MDFFGPKKKSYLSWSSPTTRRLSLTTIRNEEPFEATISQTTSFPLSNTSHGQIDKFLSLLLLWIIVSASFAQKLLVEYLSQVKVPIDQHYSSQTRKMENFDMLSISRNSMATQSRTQDSLLSLTHSLHLLEDAQSIQDSIFFPDTMLGSSIQSRPHIIPNTSRTPTLHMFTSRLH